MVEAGYFMDFFDLITILFLNKYNKQPLHLFGFIGLIFFTGGIISESILLYYKYALGHFFKDHVALLMFGVMLIVIGIQFFSIGLLGELFIKYNQNSDSRIKKEFLKNKNFQSLKMNIL